MSELANYSIETDQLIWLAFKDGQSVRVPIGQLPRYLTPRDLQRIRRAMKLRRDFFRHHMPPALIALLVLGLALAVFAGQQTVAFIWNRTHAAPAPAPTTEIVRTLTPTGASPSPVPAAPASPPAGRVAAAATRRPAAAKPKAVPKLPAVTAKAAGVAVAVTPLAVPELPLPSPEPTVLPSPDPTPPPGGEVLGDSTIAAEQPPLTQ
ncbi:MAG TPA: hypothetical protein VMT30_05985 [Candidatus Saccharimonadia bacterium]|nr:hypothetical protein [Candidatus Saccharimonadia bacterium]